jgi:hypothetical protein
MVELGFHYSHGMNATARGDLLWSTLHNVIFGSIVCGIFWRRGNGTKHKGRRLTLIGAPLPWS